MRRRNFIQRLLALAGAGAAAPVAAKLETESLADGPEDLKDVIYHISPAETPFMQLASKVEIYGESGWTKDELYFYNEREYMMRKKLDDLRSDMEQALLNKTGIPHRRWDD